MMTTVELTITENNKIRKQVTIELVTEQDIEVERYFAGLDDASKKMYDSLPPAIDDVREVVINL